jgi:hypothetical protein
MSPETATKTATRLNWSTLRHLAVSAKLLKWRVEHPQADTLDMRLGRAIHCAILEPLEYPKRWIVAGPCEATKKDGAACGSQGSLYLDGGWYCRVRGHGPEGAGPLPDGVEVLTEADVQTVKTCAAAVAEHKLATRTLTGGLPEHEIEWTEPETGIACRGRIDYLRPSQVVDLKSTIEETVRAFERTVANRMYHAQLAWYHDGAVHAGRLQPDAPLPVIVSVQKVEPYDVVVYQLSKHTYQAGQILYRDLLLRYRDCVAADHWPGIAPSMVELELPKWAPGMNGSEYEGGGW